jgi:hypothetical protein
MKAGGWVEGSDEPEIGTGKYSTHFVCLSQIILYFAADEGARRAICDMTLLMFHLVLSSITFEGVDILVASKVLKWNLQRYPNGILQVILIK